MSVILSKTIYTSVILNKIRKQFITYQWSWVKHENNLHVSDPEKNNLHVSDPT